jgi:small-conductance mechanosensitive channel
MTAKSKEGGLSNNFHHMLLNIGKLAAQSGGRVTKILLILVLAAVASRLAARLTHRAISSLGSRAGIQARYRRAPGRANAVGSSVAGVARLMIWVIAIPMILSEVGLNLGPLIAGATIVGAALGFGAQSLVKDLLSGFLILTEDQYAAGDTIIIGTQSGTVEDVNLLRTRMRGDDGKVWFVANGEIRTVANASLEWGQATVDILVPVAEDLDAAIEAAGQEALAFASEPQWKDLVLAAPKAFADSVSPDGVKLRVTARTPAGMNAKVAQALLPRITRRVRAVTSGAVALPAAPAQGGAPVPAAAAVGATGATEPTGPPASSDPTSSAFPPAAATPPLSPAAQPGTQPAGNDPPASASSPPAPPGGSSDEEGGIEGAGRV